MWVKEHDGGLKVFYWDFAHMRDGGEEGEKKEIALRRFYGEEV